MRKNALAIAMSVALVFLLVKSVYATGAYIWPVKVILRPNITSGQVKLVNTYDNGQPLFLEVKNQDSFSVNVDFAASGLDVMLDQSRVSLQPGETKDVPFSIVITNAGTYSGSITATYSAQQDSMTPSLSSEITVYATSTGSSTNNNPPSKPTLSSPLNSYSGNDTSLLFSWSASTDSDSPSIYYNYQLTKSGSTSPGISGVSLTNQKIISVGHGRWSWIVIATDGKYNTSSDAWQFSINNPPIQPQPITPSNGSVLTQKPVLNWTFGDIDGDVVTYNLLVDDNSDFSSPVIQKNLTDSFYSTASETLANNVVYYWKVKADDGFVQTSFSSVGTFTLNVTAPQPTCSDGIQNQGETGVDCGGPCTACPAQPQNNGNSASSSSSSSSGGGSGGGSSSSGSQNNSVNRTSSTQSSQGNITNTQTNNTVINATQSSQGNITNTQTNKPTGLFVLAQPQYWVSFIILIAGGIGFYFFYRSRHGESSDQRWKQRWNR